MSVSMDVERYPSSTRRPNDASPSSLERDALKWFRPAPGPFQIDDTFGTEQPQGIPEVVTETNATVFMAATKARVDRDTPEVQLKSAAAVRRRKQGSDRAARVGAQPWKDLRVPHNERNASKRLADDRRFALKASWSGLCGPDQTGGAAKQRASSGGRGDGTSTPVRRSLICHRRRLVSGSRA